jgi:hypothetical protein
MAAGDARRSGIGHRDSENSYSKCQNRSEEGCDLIDQIEEVRAAFGDLIQALAQRDREMQAEKEQEEIDLATAEEMEMDMPPFAKAWESLINAGPVVAPLARHRQ